MKSLKRPCFDLCTISLGSRGGDIGGGGKVGDGDDGDDGGEDDGESKTGPFTR